jgi:hypothetical protein
MKIVRKEVFSRERELFHVIFVTYQFKTVSVRKNLKGHSMEEGTFKTPILQCRLYWCFCLGWYSNFVGSESGHKKSVKLQQIMVYYNTTQHPPPLPHTVCMVYTVRLLWEGGEGWECQREVTGAFTRGVEKQHD